ncbi:ABC transporter substrate-binding protein [Burkholderia metallica]|uniref:ABC transporter substrate-binding protein n=1 Tax=Burkholderia metallica TaxID=488729 RepID=UPI000D1ACFA6|nr:ABC transporter substrate-binding protein [Burkholderia metallica]
MKFGNWLAIGMLAVGLLCSNGAQAQGKIVVGYTMAPDFAAFFIAKEEGYFAKRNLDVDLKFLTLTSNMPAALVSGAVQIGGCTPPVFLQAVDGGLDLVGVAGGGVYDNTGGVVQIVSRAGTNIRSAKDLVGKKFGMPGLNGTLHVMVRKWLTDKGVDPKGVTFIEVPLPQIPDVMKGGTIDAAITGEPFVGRMLATQGASIVPGFSTDLTSGFSTVMYATTRTWAAAHAAQLTAFRAALAEAIRFANSHRDQAYKDLGKYFKVPPSFLRATPWPVLSADLPESQMSFWVDAMTKQQMLRKSPSLASLVVR